MSTPGTSTEDIWAYPCDCIKLNGLLWALEAKGIIPITGGISDNIYELGPEQYSHESTDCGWTCVQWGLWE